MDRVLMLKQIRNKNKKWYQFWKPAWISKRYYLKVEDGFVITDEKLDYRESEEIRKNLCFRVGGE